MSDLEAIKTVLECKDIKEIRNGLYEGHLTDGRYFLCGRANGALEAEIYVKESDVADENVQEYINIRD